MDGYTIGDLTDIVRASGGGPSNKQSAVAEEPVSISVDSWQFPVCTSSNNNNDKSSGVVVVPPSSSGMDDGFGDPFSDMGDPLLLHGLDPIFSLRSSSAASPVDMLDVTCSNDIFIPNMFTRMLQMPTGDSNQDHQLPVTSSESPIIPSSSIIKEIKIGNGSPGLVSHHHDGAADGKISLSKSKGCLMKSTTMQISSSTNNSGIKRRKSQEKKVVCIPAPAAANSRATGEVVPSDLWAWRKYGQKPIKGSPYPRGYYRCSSSKGCSARKQVERSRTDPNMLVITYTSEHNHPWPTQRNALAGSTRSQPSKSNNSSASNNTNVPKNSPLVQKEATALTKEPNDAADDASGNTALSIKVETEDAERHVEVDGIRELNTDFSNSCYRPSHPKEATRSDDLFAYLGEIHGDPLNLLFNHAFGDGGNKDPQGLDPSGIFEWPEEQNPMFGVNDTNEDHIHIQTIT